MDSYLVDRGEIVYEGGEEDPYSFFKPSCDSIRHSVDLATWGDKVHGSSFTDEVPQEERIQRWSLSTQISSTSSYRILLNTFSS